MIVLVIFTLHISGYYFGLLFNYAFMCYCLNIFPIQDISFQVLNDVSDIEHFTHYERRIVATIHSHSASVFGHFYAMSSQSIKLVMVQQIRPLCVGNSFAFHLPMLLAALSQFIIMRMKKTLYEWDVASVWTRVRTLSQHLSSFFNETVAIFSLARRY